MALVPLQTGHVPEIARLHAQSLRGDFLPSLGEGFLRVLYRTALARGMGSGWVWVENGPALGFILGCLDTRAFFRGVLKAAALSLAAAALPSVLGRPALLGRVAETFAYPRREVLPEVSAELLVIAVAESARRRGIGRQLVSALTEDFRARAIGGYKVTVLQSNDPANAFYRGLGFRMAGEFTLYQRVWNLYHYRLA